MSKLERFRGLSNNQVAELSEEDFEYYNYHVAGLQSTLFVFYIFGDNKINTWRYKNIPVTWEFIGSGHIHPFNKKVKSLFEREEQFMGLIKTKVQMRKYLDSFFKSLKQKGIIKKYKIRNKYLP